MTKLAHSSVVDCSILITLRRFLTVGVGSGTPRTGLPFAARDWQTCDMATNQPVELGSMPDADFLADRQRSSRSGQGPATSSIRTCTLEENGTSGASAAFGGSSSLSSFGDYAERTVHGLAVRKQGSEIGLNHHQIGSSRRPAIVLASNAASQLREIILRSKIITLFSCRFLLHTVFARSSSQGAR